MKARKPASLTRRDLASLAAPLPLLAVALNAQTQAAPVDELAAARQRLQSAAQELRKFKVPIATEPSFAFHP